jgi:tyrosinase
MVTAAAASAGSTEQTRIISLPFPPEEGPAPFTRADLVFTGVDHSGSSYEVRLFLNDPAATADTPRTAEHGYAGRFTVFGHGGCYGDEGHCEVPAPSADPTDLRPAHPLTPLDTFVTITDALRRVLPGVHHPPARQPAARARATALRPHVTARLSHLDRS